MMAVLVLKFSCTSEKDHFTAIIDFLLFRMVTRKDIQHQIRSLQHQIHHDIERSDRGSAKKIRRKREGITGVAAGFAEYFGIDPTWIRLGLVGGTIFSGGILIIPYCILAFALPREGYNSGVEHFAIQYGQDWPMPIDDLPESTETQRVCWSCDTVTKPRAKYCHACGEKL